MYYLNLAEQKMVALSKSCGRCFLSLSRDKASEQILAGVYLFFTKKRFKNIRFCLFVFFSFILDDRANMSGSILSFFSSKRTQG